MKNMATKKQSSDTATCLVLCAGYLTGNFYEAGTVLEGVPADVAAARVDMLDSHESAVKHARGEGAPVVAYQAE